MTEYYVYAHTKPCGEIFYIGKGCGKRAWSKKDRNNHWKNIVNKYGYNVVILIDALSETDALQYEIDVIAHFSKFKKLCNRTMGGEGAKGLKHNAEFKKKRSDYMKSDLNPMKRKEVRDKLAKSISGENHPMKLAENKAKVMGEKNYFYGRSGKLNVKSKPVEIDGIKYESIRIAAQELGMKYMTLYSRLYRK